MSDTGEQALFPHRHRRGTLGRTQAGESSFLGLGSQVEGILMPMQQDGLWLARLSFKKAKT